MKNLEIKKNKGLGLNFMLLIEFTIHMLFILVAVLGKSFGKSSYPLYMILDNYFMTCLLINPIIISTIAKKVIEMEEKNNMWQLQTSLGEYISNILVNKIAILAIKIGTLQIIEWIIILLLANRNPNLILGTSTIKRLVIYFFSEYSINLFLLNLFMIVEMKSNKVYFSLFFSIIGAMTGIICMLTSKVLSQINPFAWFVSMLNISYTKQGGEFIQSVNDINYLTFIISLICIIVEFMILKNINSYSLNKDL
ncbi:hypothetical protein [Anaerococcus cruorum]|uniref:ABC transporter permease n=1 Tax=Anaerococcus cruorum TaxID=3115617 RepID=A0ABW9MXN1_9FIRM